MKKLLCILALSTGSLFAACGTECCDPCGYDSCDCDPCQTCNTCDTCCATPCCCEPCDFIEPCPPEIKAYNAPVIIDIKCAWDVFASVSFVYAQAKEENLTFMTSTRSGASVDNVSKTTSSYPEVCFDYEPAFKVGFGFNIGCDDWIVDVEYLRYHANVGKGLFTDSVVTADNIDLNGSFYWAAYEGDFIRPIAGGDNTSNGSNSASTKWRLNMDIVDFNLSREYYVGKCLTYKTTVGLRAAWIDQTYNITYTRVNPDGETGVTFVDKSNNSIDSWAVGPRTAMNTRWHFCDGFFLFGDAAFSILYTDYDITADLTHEEYDTGALTQTDLFCASRSLCFLRPQANLNLGLGWSEYFCCNDWFFDLRIGYEFHTFWNQNVFQARYQQGQDPADFQGNLYLHGLVITGRLDF